MASKFLLEIVTPHRKFYEKSVDRIVVRGMEGEMAILKDHTPLVTPLAIGKIIIINDEKEEEATLAGGFIQITGEKVVIVTESAEWPQEIDLERAKAARQRAEERLNSGKEVDQDRADEALRKANVRIDMAEKYGK